MNDSSIIYSYRRISKTTWWLFQFSSFHIIINVFHLFFYILIHSTTSSNHIYQQNSLYFLTLTCSSSFAQHNRISSPSPLPSSLQLPLPPLFPTIKAINRITFLSLFPLSNFFPNSAEFCSFSLTNIFSNLFRFCSRFFFSFSVSYISFYFPQFYNTHYTTKWPWIHKSMPV